MYFERVEHISDDSEFSLQAMLVSSEALELSPAPIRRAWMEGTPDRFANRCLPLLVANQSGWIVTTRSDIRCTWDGTQSLHGVRVSVDDAGDGSAPMVSSHFGNGIVTFTLPWLFRTAPGWNLLVRGPANWPVDGAHPLEGLVETDWSDATFTMNWMLTRPHHEVLFPAGTPVSMIVPQRRGELEQFEPSFGVINADREQYDSYTAWREGRLEFNQQLQVAGSPAQKEKWQRDYFLGRTPAARAAGHQRRRDLKPFAGLPTPPPVTEAPAAPAPVAGPASASCPALSSPALAGCPAPFPGLSVASPARCGEADEQPHAKMPPAL